MYVQNFKKLKLIQAHLLEEVNYRLISLQTSTLSHCRLGGTVSERLLPGNNMTKPQQQR